MVWGARGGWWGNNVPTGCFLYVCLDGSVTFLLQFQGGVAKLQAFLQGGGVATLQACLQGGVISYVTSILCKLCSTK